MGRTKNIYTIFLRLCLQLPIILFFSFFKRKKRLLNLSTAVCKIYRYKNIGLYLSIQTSIDHWGFFRAFEVYAYNQITQMLQNWIALRTKVTEDWRKERKKNDTNIEWNAHVMIALCEKVNVVSERQANGIYLDIFTVTVFFIISSRLLCVMYKMKLT